LGVTFATGGCEERVRRDGRLVEERSAGVVVTAAAFFAASFAYSGAIITEAIAIVAIHRNGNLTIPPKLCLSLILSGRSRTGSIVGRIPLNKL
jgi:hypothetical protein